MPIDPPLPALSELPGFEILSPVEAERLDRLLTRRTFRPHDPVECAQELVIVGSGSLDLSLGGPRGVRLGSEPSGGLLGEIGLFAHPTQPLLGMARAEASGFSLSHSALKRSFHYSRPLLVKFMVICGRGLARKMRAANQALAALDLVRGESGLPPLSPTPLVERDLKRARALAAAREFKDGEVILEEGGRSRELYILGQGTVEVEHRRGGTTSTLARLGPGDFFGEMAFIDEAPRSAGARARGPVKVHVVPPDTLDRALEMDTGVAIYLTNLLCKVMARRLDATLARIAALTEEGGGRRA